MNDVGTIRIDSVKEYYKTVELYKGNKLFRGQAVSEWDIVPGAFRGNCVKDKVAEECRKFGLIHTEEVLKKVLELQHWGEKTRLCDLSINPSVSLYFVIEDDIQRNQDGAVFIIDRDKAYNFNSVQIKILMRIAQGDLHNFKEIKDAVKNELHLNLSDGEIKDAVTKNAVIDYDMDIAYSNPRAIIQGGTGIYFGYAFDSKDNLVEKGNLDIAGIIKKIIIPHEIKSQIIEHLNTLGIYGDLLYDKAKAVSNSRLLYNIQEINNIRRHFGQKIELSLYVSKLSFTNDNIRRIVDEVYKKYKKKYGKSARISINVYHDSEDRRHMNCNWIARTIPDSNSVNYELIFNEDYRISRMNNLNKEISIFEIMRLAEPIVKECKHFLLEIERAHSLFENGSIMRNEYAEVLKKAYIKRYKLILHDMNNIEHGGEQYDAYYEGAIYFCESVYYLAKDLYNDLDKGEQDSLLEMHYKNWYEKCIKNYEIYYTEVRKISIENMIIIP